MAVRLAQDIVLSIRHIFHHKQLNSSKTGISKYSVLPLSHACKCCKVSSRHFFFKPHSQTIAARQPSVLSWYSTFWSRATLRANLFLPKISARFRQVRGGATFMLMPKAAIDKNDCVIFFQHQIGWTWQFLIMQPKTEALPVQCRPYPFFWLGIFTANGGHRSWTGRWIDTVSHYWAIKWLKQSCLFIMITMYKLV